VHISPGYGFKIHDPENEIHDAILVVSFANYTVREFLDSDRISTSAVAFFHVPQQPFILVLVSGNSPSPRLH
jgi:hypothetical protein